MFFSMLGQLIFNDEMTQNVACHVNITTSSSAQHLTGVHGGSSEEQSGVEIPVWQLLLWHCVCLSHLSQH